MNKYKYKNKLVKLWNYRKNKYKYKNKLVKLWNRINKYKYQKQTGKAVEQEK